MSDDQIVWKYKIPEAARPPMQRRIWSVRAAT